MRGDTGCNCECACHGRKTAEIGINNVFIIQISIFLCSCLFHWSRQETSTMWKPVLGIPGKILFPLIQDIRSQELCGFTFRQCYFIETKCHCNTGFSHVRRQPDYTCYLLSEALKSVEFPEWAAKTEHLSFRKKNINFQLIMVSYFMESETPWIPIFRKDDLLFLYLQIKMYNRWQTKRQTNRRSFLKLYI